MGRRNGRKREKDRIPFHCHLSCLVSIWHLGLVSPILSSEFFLTPLSFFLGYFPLSHSRDSSALTSSLLFYTYSYLSVCSPLKHLLSALSLRHISSSHCLPTRHFFAAFSVSSHLTNYILRTSLAWKLPMQWILLGVQTQCKPSAQYNLTFMLLRFFKKTDAWLRRVIGDCNVVWSCRSMQIGGKIYTYLVLKLWFCKSVKFFTDSSTATLLLNVTKEVLYMRLKLNQTSYLLCVKIDLVVL